MLNAGHGLFDDFDTVAEQIIAEAEVIAQEYGILLRASGATDPRRSLEAASQRDQQPWLACMRPWTTAYVTANGNCLPCCISPFATKDYESLRMGNLFEQEFASIWNDVPYQVWREQLLGEVPPEPCRGCGVHWSL
jgi:MoaA/NifB/PqqE/SkfB family radical SAM enzyme